MNTENQIITQDLFTKLRTNIREIADALTKGNYSVRIKLETNNEDLLRLQNDLNQIIELIQLNLNMSLMGDDSVINKFIDIFSAFANRDFTKKLEISEQGTILDAIGEGINMLGQELEYSTVSKNELENERNRLSQTQDIAKICDWEFYHIEKKLICSKTFFPLLEIEPADFDGILAQFTAKLPQEDKAQAEHIISELQLNWNYSFENKIILNDGSYKYLLHIVNHILDEHSNHIGFKGIVQDISILKESQLRLKYQTELEKLIADLSSKFINYKNNNIKTEINNALHDCCNFFNVNRAYYIKIKGNSTNDIDSFEFNDAFVRYNTNDLFAESPQIFDTCVNTAKSNQIIQFNNVEIQKTETKEEDELLTKFGVKAFICIPVYSNDEEFAIFGMDCTTNSRVWSIEEINGLKIISNIISDVINRDSFEKELIAARDKAEENERLKTAFLTNISHEIRTPMNGIIGFAELLKIPNLSGEKQQEFISIIEKSGERMLNTIDDLINISKLEAGQMTITYSETDIDEALDYLYNFFMPETQKKDIQLILKYPSENYQKKIKTDKEKLYATLTNLIKNAIKFTNSGSIEFGFITNKDFYEFYVKDTGIGVPQNKQKAIFDRFVQADHSIIRNHEGSGLGLSISKAYVEMLGGKIWLESESGKGSCFCFTIPVELIDNTDEIIQNYYKTSTPEIFENNSILVAEDDEDSLLLISHVLKSLFSGYHTARTGLEAIEKYRNHPEIKLVLMDINMPEMDGYTASKILKQTNPDLIIIAQTAFALDIEREQYADIFDEYITKPVRIKNLLEVINKFTKQ